MRFLGIGESCDLGDMYHRLALAGHEVRMYIGSEDAHGVYSGIVQRTADWREDLAWLREVGAQGIIIFESASHGALQDRLRNEGYQVIGGSAFGDRLEADRAFGQEQLRGRGLPTAACRHFSDFSTALDFLRVHPARYVFKSNGADSMRSRNYIGELTDGADMIALLSAYQSRWQVPAPPDFVLMDHIQGVEVGVGAYFNGTRFLAPACLDWEHKRFFAGDLGELTGEMGTVVTYRGAERIFAQTLAPMTDVLQEGRYCGYINLNLIANDEGLWPLEFTSRFGYPGYAICEALHEEPWESLFVKMLTGSQTPIATRSGYAAGVVLTVPPFPYRFGYPELSKGLPISFRGSMTKDDHAALHLAEVEMRGNTLVTSGTIGYVGVATGTGDCVADACQRAYDLVGKVVVPNLRYRTDIGDRVINHDLATLASLGYLS